MEGWHTALSELDRFALVTGAAQCHEILSLVASSRHDRLLVMDVQIFRLLTAPGTTILLLLQNQLATYERGPNATIGHRSLKRLHCDGALALSKIRHCQDCSVVELEVLTEVIQLMYVLRHTPDLGLDSMELYRQRSQMRGAAVARENSDLPRSKLFKNRSQVIVVPLVNRL